VADLNNIMSMVPYNVMPNRVDIIIFLFLSESESEFDRCNDVSMVLVLVLGSVMNIQKHLCVFEYLPEICL